MLLQSGCAEVFQAAYLQLEPVHVDLFLLSFCKIETYSAASAMLPFASIGDAVMPKILGRSDTSVFSYDSRMILFKCQISYCACCLDVSILTEHKDVLSSCDGPHRRSKD